MAPILPYLTDSAEQIEQTVAAVAAAGATHATGIALHLRPGAREWWMAWLAREHPDLLPRYRALYRGGSYAAPAYRRLIQDRIGALVRRYGIGAPGAITGTGIDSRRSQPLPEPREPPQQLRLL